MRNFKINKSRLYKHFKNYGSKIENNGIRWIVTLFETDRPSSYNKIMFDFGIDAMEILVLYFRDLEEFEICAELKKKIKKHKEITTYEYS